MLLRINKCLVGGGGCERRHETYLGRFRTAWKHRGTEFDGSLVNIEASDWDSSRQGERVGYEGLEKQCTGTPLQGVASDI